MKTVFAGGKDVGQGVPGPESDLKALAATYPVVFDSLHVDCAKLSFAIPVKGDKARVIVIQKDQLLTESMELVMAIEEGMAVSDTERDILKVAVVERHHGTGNIGLGFVQGIGLQNGAIASSVGHDSHNIMVIGTDDQDMELVVRTIVAQGGGVAVVADGEVTASLVLDVAGLMASADAKTISLKFSAVLQAARRQGVQVADPFMLMSFLALPVIPHLKITDLGLVNVDTFSHTDLWC